MPTQRLSSPNQISESDFQKQVIDLAQTLGYGLIYHNPDSRRSQAGFPDLILGNYKTSRVLARELKTATGKLSPEQVTWITTMQAAGINAGVWRPEDLTNGHITKDLRGQP